MLYRHDEPRLEVVTQERPWSFDGDGALSRLVSEAQRIRLAHLFDPLLAVHTSVVDPQPHQITGVYKAMLPRQPLRFRTRRQTPLRDQVDLVGARTRAASERRDRLSRQKRPQERFLVGARLLVTRTLVLAQPILAALRARGAFPISRSRAHTHRRHGHPLQTVPSAGLIERPQEKNRVDALR